MIGSKQPSFYEDKAVPRSKAQVSVAKSASRLDVPNNWTHPSGATVGSFHRDAMSTFAITVQNQDQAFWGNWHIKTSVQQSSEWGELLAPQTRTTLSHGRPVFKPVVEVHSDVELCFTGQVWLIRDNHRLYAMKNSSSSLPFHEIRNPGQSFP